jgi:hypothetical protein
MEDANLIVRIAKGIREFKRLGQNSMGLGCPVPD